ncbi:alpha/beta fold hydrolase [Terriglobus albidus]|uniref:Alpha/beta fold hydrolase n=1 Tax=Terriglobus albidus TaxID=1592106 RepID=A0A5B9EI83_9BACT|nr:alpha/beta fold hydrolase [Terriglobus albidus]QEE30560.1 alpha/beta fold hydrolase [Terriglobus albidus]
MGLTSSRKIATDAIRWNPSKFAPFVLMVLSTCGVLSQAKAQTSQAVTANSNSTVSMNERQEDAHYVNYKFRDGQSLSDLRFHYLVLGHPHKDSSGNIDNAVLFLHWTNASSEALSNAEFRSALFSAGGPLDEARYFVIIPDEVGHGRSSKPSDGLKMAFPHYGYSDMVDLQHKLVVETLGIQHLHAVIGMSMGCMNAWQWAESYPDAMDGIMPIACFPAPISGRNLLWRRMLVNDIRSDPGWEDGNYQHQPPSAARGLLLARLMIDGVPALQQEVRSAQSADGFIQGVKRQAATVDANDLLYSFESSSDFDAEPGLRQITTKVFALNFADDEFYRDTLQVLQHDMDQVHSGKIVIRPVSAGSTGHFTMSHPSLWRDQVAAFMQSLNVVSE